MALNFKQKPMVGFVLIPEKNQLWITDGENKEEKEMDQRMNQFFE